MPEVDCRRKSIKRKSIKRKSIKRNREDGRSIKGMKMEELAGKKYKRAILIAAGSFFGLPFSIGEEDFVIAIDGGMEYCKKEGISPDLLLGDFDSYFAEKECQAASFTSAEKEDQVALFTSGETNKEKSKGENYKPEQYSIFGKKSMPDSLLKPDNSSSLPVISLPVIKNDTDLHAAVKFSLKQGIKIVHILGALGGERMDHSLAALQSLAFLTEQGGEGYLYGERQVFTALRNGTKSFSAKYKGYVSVFSFSDTCSGVSEKGLKYLINHVSLRNIEPVGISNEFIGEEAEIKVEEGTLILCYEPLQA